MYQVYNTVTGIVARTVNNVVKANEIAEVMTEQSRYDRGHTFEVRLSRGARTWLAE
jgi:hypothetical protein